MRRLVLSILASITAAGALGQTPAGGMFLVATPQLRDPRFAETVVLLLNYGREGAIGVVVNRPTWVDPEALFPGDDFFRRYRGTVYFGGPVARTSTLFLVRDADRVDGEPIVDDVFVTADEDEARETVPARADGRVLRVYAGYAGWGPGQLDREIAAGDWQVIPASGDLIFTPEPASLWREVHRVTADMGIVGLPSIFRTGNQCAGAEGNGYFHVSPWQGQLPAYARHLVNSLESLACQAARGKGPASPTSVTDWLRMAPDMPMSAWQ